LILTYEVNLLSILREKYDKNVNYKRYTGCPDQIGGNLKKALLHNQKTCRQRKGSFGIVRKRTIKYVFV
jgi:hypothetical protein